MLCQYVKERLRWNADVCGVGRVFLPFCGEGGIADCFKVWQWGSSGKFAPPLSRTCGSVLPQKISRFCRPLQWEGFPAAKIVQRICGMRAMERYCAITDDNGRYCALLRNNWFFANVLQSICKICKTYMLHFLHVRRKYFAFLQFCTILRYMVARG